MLVALGFSALCVSGLVLLIIDAVQHFQQDSLSVYLDQAAKLADAVQRWFLVFGVNLEAHMILDVIKEQIPAMELVQGTLTMAVDGLGNALLVLLVVLYLLAENNTHIPGSLRAKVDAQIQRYVVIKTAISAMQGLLVYFIMGTILHVRMAHLFGVLHFLLNYIPTAGPIIATVIPLPIVVLDPELSVAAKIAAFAGPTFVHMIIGNVAEPMVFGSSMELHPVTVLLALALWYALWGIPGAILAVPITAVQRIILHALDHPYASIAISIMEGRLSAATAELDYYATEAASAAALSASAAASQMIDSVDLEAAPSGSVGGGAGGQSSPSREPATGRDRQSSLDSQFLNWASLEGSDHGPSVPLNALSSAPPPITSAGISDDEGGVLPESSPRVASGSGGGTDALLQSGWGGASHALAAGLAKGAQVGGTGIARAAPM